MLSMFMNMKKKQALQPFPYYIMASTSFFSPILSKPSIAYIINSFHVIPPPPTSLLHLHHYTKKTRQISSSSSSIPYQPINIDYLNEEFGIHDGITFEYLGDSCIAKMALQSGSTATLMLPTGLITSYKASMWHGGILELLHTCVSEEHMINGKPEPLIQGGVSLAFSFLADSQQQQSQCNWLLKDIRGDSQEFIQVQLVSSMDTNGGGQVEIQHIVTLEQDVLTSQIVISNKCCLPVEISGSLITHLTVSSPEATCAIGLQGSDFSTRPPLQSTFSIIPPDFGSTQKSSNLFAGWSWSNQVSHTKPEEMEGQEDEESKHLSEEISRIYTTAPRNFTILDRGRRNSIMVGRDGFEELYMMSPGSSHEFYSKYAYICVGQSALLKTIIIAPGDVWRGSQRLHNPNL